MCKHQWSKQVKHEIIFMQGKGNYNHRGKNGNVKESKKENKKVGRLPRWGARGDCENGARPWELTARIQDLHLNLSLLLKKSS